MNRDFKIYIDGDKQIIERFVYPKLKGEITFNGGISDIENIEVNEEVLDAGDIARALREVGEYLINYKHKENE